jgi:hypothetical protein
MIESTVEVDVKTPKASKIVIFFFRLIGDFLRFNFLKFKKKPIKL